MANRNQNSTLWDLPTRAFHWMIVFSIPLAWWSAEEQRYDIHQWVGYTVLVLVVGRIVWGFIGSHYSRFTSFIVNPARTFSYLKGEHVEYIGHNPAGAWSVVVMLLLLLLQAGSGLFNTDDVLFSGPFYYAASPELQGLMGSVHDVVFKLIVVLIVSHIAAIAYHQWKGNNLVKAMLDGGTVEQKNVQASAPLWRWLLVILLLSLLLWWAIEQAPQPTNSWW